MITQHLITRSLLTFFLVSILTGAFPAIAQKTESPCQLDLERDPTELADEDNPLAGRLGTSLKDWETLFGRPTGDDKLFPEYDVEGCGTVLLTLNEDNTVVTGIWAYAPRDMDRSLEESDPDDWTVGHAQLVGASFAPIDSERGETYTVPNPYGYIRYDYFSEQLSTEVDESNWDYVDNDPDYGSYSIVYRLTEDDTFVSVSLSLSLEDPPLVVD